MGDPFRISNNNEIKEIYPANTKFYVRSYSNIDTSIS